MDKNKWVPVIVAVLITLIIGGWYIISGRTSLNKNIRSLTEVEEITEINTKDPNRVTIKCKNGESYEIMFTQDQQNYDELIFNACGEEGAQESE